MKKLVLPIAVLAMLTLIGTAVVIDCVRLASAARQRVALADDEMQKQETRFLKLLSGNAKVTPEVQAAMAAYQAANTPVARHSSYDTLTSSFRDTMAAKVDSNNTLERKFIDDIAGAINRRDVSQKQYDEELAAYRRYLLSPRGKIAQMFSSTARTDAG